MFLFFHSSLLFPWIFLMLLQTVNLNNSGTRIHLCEGSPRPHPGLVWWFTRKTQVCVQVCPIAQLYLTLLSCTWLFATPWTVAHQAPLSMGFSRQEYWVGLPFLPPGHLPNPDIKPASPTSPVWAGEFFTTEPPGKPQKNSRVLGK